MAPRLMFRLTYLLMYMQGITLIWSLLRNGHELLGGNPVAHRCIICCPTSLVSNWESECKKWLQVCWQLHCRRLQVLACLSILNAAIVQPDS